MLTTMTIIAVALTCLTIYYATKAKDQAAKKEKAEAESKRILTQSIESDKAFQKVIDNKDAEKVVLIDEINRIKKEYDIREYAWEETKKSFLDKVAQLTDLREINSRQAETIKRYAAEIEKMQAKNKVEPIDKIDWSKPVAFPEDYILPKGIAVRAIRVRESNFIKEGTLVTLTGDGSYNPHCIKDGDPKPCYAQIDCFAPLNPKDHPNYKKPVYKFDEAKAPKAGKSKARQEAAAKKVRNELGQFA